MLRLASSAVLAMLLSQPAIAQVCERNGQVDQQTTEQLRRLIARPDLRVMRSVVGSWYAERPNPGTGQVQYGTQTFGADGRFSYQNRVCGGMMRGCMTYSGSGQFAGVMLGNGQISLIIAYSDREVTNACIGSVIRVIGPGQIQDATGVISRRVR